MSPNRMRLPLMMIGCLAFLLGFLSTSMSTVSGEELSGVSAEPSGSPSPVSQNPGEGAPSKRTATSCLVDEAAIEDLRAQREALVVRQKELAAREGELKAREQALAEEFRRFEALRGDAGKIDTARKQESDARVGKLVETFETMSPKAASQVLGSLDESLAVAAMSKISTAKLAKILNVMEPRKSSRLTELMAGVVRARDTAGRRNSQNPMSPDMDETTPVPAGTAPKSGPVGKEARKGGENI